MKVDECSMTEEDWLASAEPLGIYRADPRIRPDQMLQYLRVHRKVDQTKHGRRKLRLFACACCRRFWPLLSEKSREALEIAERYTDGEASKKDLGYGWRISVRQYGNGLRTADGIAGHVVEASAMTAAALVPMVSNSVVASTPKRSHELWSEQFQQAAIIYDLFGNPFRRTAAEVASQFAIVESIKKLAEHIYQSGHHPDLSELAKALEQVGCTSSEVLEHSRRPEHFRGCWLLDALRGTPC